MENVLLIVFIAEAIVLELIWIFSDPRPITEQFQSRIGLKKGYTRAALIFGLLFIVIYHFFLKGLQLQVPHNQFDGVFEIVGFCISSAGGIFAIWARLTMKEHWAVAGEEHNIKRQNKLITDGPFRFSRNPIYVGLVLFYLGAGIEFRTYLIVLVLFPMIYFYISAVQEEKTLEIIFGKEYTEYKKAVHRFL